MAVKPIFNGTSANKNAKLTKKGGIPVRLCLIVTGLLVMLIAAGTAAS